MVLGNLPVPGRPTILITVGQGPTALAVGAGGGCLDIFTLNCPFFPLSLSLWETARYRLKYCLKGPLNPKPTKKSIRFRSYGLDTVNYRGNKNQKPKKQELSSLFMTHRLNVMHAPLMFHEYIPYGSGVNAQTRSGMDGCTGRTGITLNALQLFFELVGA